MGTKLASGLVLGFLLTLTADSSAAARSSRAKSKALVAMTIGVYDYAHTEAHVLLRAEQTAAAILSKAGVETVWFTCSTEGVSPGNPACSASGDLTHLTLIILPESMSSGLRSVSRDALGFAGLHTELSCDAWVLFDRVKKFAGEEGVAFDHVLGAVFAHELGHLLLNVNAHSEAGLMHASWSRRELLAIEVGQLGFSEVESKRIQSGATARHQAASSLLVRALSVDSRAHPN